MILALNKTPDASDFPAANGRQEARFELSEPCRVERWRRPFHAVTRNISEGGICLDIVGMGSTIMDADVSIYIRDFPPIGATARWSHKRTFGLKFLTPIEDNAELFAFFKKLR